MISVGMARDNDVYFIRAVVLSDMRYELFARVLGSPIYDNHGLLLAAPDQIAEAQRDSISAPFAFSNFQEIHFVTHNLAILPVRYRMDVGQLSTVFHKP